MALRGDNTGGCSLDKRIATVNRLLVLTSFIAVPAILGFSAAWFALHGFKACAGWLVAAMIVASLGCIAVIGWLANEASV